MIELLEAKNVACNLYVCLGSRSADVLLANREVSINIGQLIRTSIAHELLLSLGFISLWQLLGFHLHGPLENDIESVGYGFILLVDHAADGEHCGNHLGC